MKFLICGYGSIGRRHLNNLVTLGERDIVLYRTHHSTLDDTEICDLPVETDLRKALQHKPEAAIICNPTALHLEVAMPAAEMGCSILLEKPVSHNLDGVDRLEQALLHGGGRLLVGFHFRYHPGLIQLKQWLTEERIGKITSIKIHWGEFLPNWHPWEDYRTGYSARADLGGGVVNTLSHPFDYLQWLFGEVESVVAITSHKGLDLPVEDTADILLNLASGSQANIHLDYIQRPGQHTIEATGTQGRLTWDNASGVASRFDIEEDKWDEVHPPVGFERNQLFLAEMSHFLEVARGKESPRCSLEAGIAALKLTQAVHRSAREGCLVKFRP